MLVRGKYVITDSSQTDAVIEDGAVCIRGNQIIAVGNENAVELDRCPAGHGLWFDQGELRAVIERSHDSEEGSVAQFFADLYRTELETQPRGDG